MPTCVALRARSRAAVAHAAVVTLWRGAARLGVVLVAYDAVNQAVAHALIRHVRFHPRRAGRVPARTRERVRFVARDVVRVGLQRHFDAVLRDDGGIVVRQSAPAPHGGHKRHVAGVGSAVGYEKVHFLVVGSLQLKCGTL